MGTFSSTRSPLFTPAPQIMSKAMSRTMSKASGASPHYEANLAIVTDEILPYQVGRISFLSSWWPALCPQNVHISEGTVVRVVGRSGITLLVEPIFLEPAAKL